MGQYSSGKRSLERTFGVLNTPKVLLVRVTVWVNPYRMCRLKTFEVKKRPQRLQMQTFGVFKNPEGLVCKDYTSDEKYQFNIKRTGKYIQAVI